MTSEKKSDAPRLPIGSITALDEKDEHAIIYTCSICRGIVIDPVTTSCDHLFCKLCLQDVSKCPVCRQEIQTSELKVLSKREQGLLGAIKIHCPYHPTCTWTGKYESVYTHIAKSCTVCPSCQVVCKSSDERQSHMEKECQANRMTCPFCQSSVINDSWDQHVCVTNKTCCLPGCRLQTTEHTHSVQEYQDALKCLSYAPSSHPACSNVRCICGARMWIFKEAGSESCGGCGQHCKKERFVYRCMTICRFSGVICSACAALPVVRGPWLNARVKIFPGLLYEELQSKGSVGTITDVISEELVQVRWDHDPSTSYYYYVSPDPKHTHLILDTSNPTELDRVYTRNDTGHAFYSKEDPTIILTTLACGKGQIIGLNAMGQVMYHYVDKRRRTLHTSMKNTVLYYRYCPRMTYQSVQPSQEGKDERKRSFLTPLESTIERKGRVRCRDVGAEVRVVGSNQTGIIMNHNWKEVEDIVVQLQNGHLAHFQANELEYVDSSSSRASSSSSSTSADTMEDDDSSDSDEDGHKQLQRLLLQALFRG